jgi:DNA primase
MVAISGRGLADATPKYVFTRGFDKASSWFRIPPISERMPITATVVVEGQYDALRVAYHVLGRRQIEVIALCGCVMSDRVAGELARRAGPIILMLDGDVAGRAGTAKAWRALRAAGLPDARNRVVHLPEGYDPDMYLREAADRGDYGVLPTMLRESRPMRLGEARAEVYRELARCATEGDDARERRLLEQLHREEGVQ